MNEVVYYFIAGLGACVVSLIVIPIVLALAHRNRWYDKIDDRKIHAADTPRLGGVGMFSSFIAVSAVAMALASRIPDVGSVGISALRISGLVIGLLLIHVVGLIDDFTNIRAIIKLFGQILAATAVAASGITIDSLSFMPLGAASSGHSLALGFLAYPVTIIWIIALSNAMNLVDGLDGYAGGISATAALFLGVVATVNGNVAQAVLSFVLFGSILGFLAFNFPPAKIFMGDSGSLFLGFALAVIPLVPGSAGGRTVPLLVPISLLLIPILDTLYAIVRRTRQRRPIYSADRGHLHHKLLELGLAPRTILAIVYSYCIVLGIVALLAVSAPRPWNIILTLVLWLGATIVFFVPTRIHLHKQTAEAEHAESHRAGVS